MSSPNAAKVNRKSKTVLLLPRVLMIVGIVFVLAAISLGALTLGPVALVEIEYSLRQGPLSPLASDITPVNTDFGIVIPKLSANSKIIMNVDPFDSRAYQTALTQGVAHARGTGLPGNPGNIFLFSHSSANFYEAARYNSIFYLLTKLEFGDEIQMYYQEKKYSYNVTSKSIVAPDAVQYLKSLEQDRETVTLMTCWPPGTTYKRLLVIAERKS